MLGQQAGHGDVCWKHRCPCPIGWLINRGVCLPLSQQATDDRWYTKPAHLFVPTGHYWLERGGFNG